MVHGHINGSNALAFLNVGDTLFKCIFHKPMVSCIHIENQSMFHKQQLCTTVFMASLKVQSFTDDQAVTVLNKEHGMCDVRDHSVTHI